MRVVTVEDVAERLYALPPEDFTRSRNEAAADLRKTGRRTEADEVKAMRKPTAAAAAANRLVREHRSEVEKFLRAAERLRDAQFAGKGDLAAATRDERQALERLVELGGAEVRQTLQAAAIDDGAAEHLLRGRLERELEATGFGTLLAHAKPAAPKGKPARPRKPDDRAARAKLREARNALTAAQAEERQARRRWEQTRADLDRAQAAVEEAQRELERIRDR